MASRSMLFIDGPKTPQIIAVLEKITGSKLQYDTKTQQVTGFTPVDPKFIKQQADLLTLIEQTNERSFEIRVRADPVAYFTGGGGYGKIESGFREPGPLAPREVIINPDLLDGQQQELESGFKMDAWDALAHELFGHGLDDILITDYHERRKDNKQKAYWEHRAKKKERETQLMFGKEPRLKVTD